MDPVSAAASVAGLLTFIVQTIKTCNDYIRSSKRSGSSAAVLVAELEMLLSNLSHLQNFLKGDGLQETSFSQTSRIVTRSHLTEERLRFLKKELERATSSRFKQAIWPFTEKEHRESIQELRNLSQWINFSLAIDSSALQSRTSDDVVTVLTKQLDSIQQLNSIENAVETVRSSLEAQTDMLYQTQKDEKRKEILAWVSDYDQERKHNDVREPRVEGSGEWLLETDAFNSWYHRGQSPAVLWCRGVQGSGKSVLASLVIDKLKTDLSSSHANAALAYFYFDHRNRDSMSSAMVISNLARQLLSTDAVMPHAVLEMHDNLGSSKPSLEVAKKIFLSACSANATIFIVLDALDESEENTYRTAILGFLDKLKHRTDFRLFVTSRHAPIDSPQVRQLHVEAQNSDLEKYISQTIDEDPVAGTVDSAFKAQLIERLITNSHGLFLLPVLQLRMVLEAPTVGEMIEAIETLPSTVYDAFDVTLSQIKLLPPAKRHLAMKSLMWIFYSGTKHRLRMMDLRQALAVREDQSLTNQTLQPSTEMILSCCRGLVTVDNATGHPRFIHQAVQEYLQSHKAEHFPNGEALLAKTCLTYLLTEPAGQHICATEDDLLARITGIPFFWYAACCWGHHVRNSWTETMRQQTLDLVVSTTGKTCIQVAQYMMGRNDLYWSFEETESITPLHIAASFGLDDIAKTLLDRQDTCVDATTTIGTTALMKASSSGRIGIMHILLENGADPEKQNWYGSSLHIAAEADQDEAIGALLQRGMDVNMYESSGRRPLDCALMEKNVNAAAALLKRGANSYMPLASKLHHIGYDIDLDLRVRAVRQKTDSDNEVALIYTIGPGKITGDALHASIEKDDLDFARLLIGNGATVHRMNRLGLMPLHWAAAKGRVEAVRLLLESGANVNAPCKYGHCKYGHTAYWYAVAFEHAIVQQLLLEFGAMACPTPTSAEKVDISNVLTLHDFDRISKSVKFPEVAARWEVLKGDPSFNWY